MSGESENLGSETSSSLKEFMNSSAGSWEVQGKLVPEPVINLANKEMNESLENLLDKRRFLPFKSALEFLPKEFDGRNIPVRKFIKNCLSAKNSINPSEHHHLFLIIKSRIVGNAETSLENQEISNLDDLLNYLKLTFGEFKQLGQLNSMLATVAQRFNESVQDYGSRVGEIVGQIIYLIQEKNDPESADGMIKTVRDAAAENFIIGLKRGLALRVRLERPKNLLEAIRIAGEAEWEMEFERTLLRGVKDEEKSPFKSKFIPKSRSYPENPRIHIASRKRELPIKREEVKEITKLEPIIKKEKIENFEIICYACKKTGHIRKDCPDKYSNKQCYSCGEMGHIKPFCSKINLENKKINNNQECQNCGMKNHSTESCRGVCKYCKKSGHLIETCYKLKNKKLYEEQKVKDEESKN